MRIHLPVVRFIRIAAALASAGAVRADTSDEIRALREQIRQLDEKLQALERKQPDQAAADATALKPAAKISVGDNGLTLASVDGASSLRLRGLVQLDSRNHLIRTTGAGDSFVLRRARIFAEGRFARNFTFQIVPEFAGSSPSLLDASVGVDLGHGMQVKAGKFKVPIGLELLQSDSWTFFDERALPTNLVPNRDLGLQFSGELSDGAVKYAAGVFNGVADGASSTNADFDSNKEVVARIAVSPFAGDPGSVFHRLSFGVAGGAGLEKSAAGLSSGDRTEAQQTFFKYRSGTVADGGVRRVSPQLDFRRGPFGLIGEYVVSTATVRPGGVAMKTVLSHRAWQVAAGYVLTGEDSSFDGVVPARAFDPAAGTWGAFEIVARYANLTIDRAAFPAVADPATNARGAASVGVGLNWYLSKMVRATFDYYRTKFAEPPPGAPLLEDGEEVLITRLQLAF
ncbi:MAG TPA: porin [Opitutus sp.]|nr:porin [Opitutus sp.]